MTDSSGNVQDSYSYDPYYNATDARWTQLDPSGQNPAYIFAGDDPVNQFDPSGLVYGSAASGTAFGSGCIEGLGGKAAINKLVQNNVEGAPEVAPEVEAAGYTFSCLVGGYEAEAHAEKNDLVENTARDTDFTELLFDILSKFD